MGHFQEIAKDHRFCHRRPLFVHSCNEEGSATVESAALSTPQICLQNH